MARRKMRSNITKAGDRAWLRNAVPMETVHPVLALVDGNIREVFNGEEQLLVE